MPLFVGQEWRKKRCTEALEEAKFRFLCSTAQVNPLQLSSDNTHWARQSAGDNLAQGGTAAHNGVESSHLRCWPAGATVLLFFLCLFCLFVGDVDRGTFILYIRHSVKLRKFLTVLPQLPHWCSGTSSIYIRFFRSFLTGVQSYTSRCHGRNAPPADPKGIWVCRSTRA